jgi:CheY-like chemotaxis protein
MKKILIVDDEEAFTRLMAMNLEDLGEYEIRTENSALNATKAAKYFKPDVVILDILMPDKSGLKIAEEWQKDQVLAKTPIIFLTAAMSKDQPIMENGIVEKHAVLIKPVSFSQLLQQIEATVGA